MSTVEETRNDLTKTLEATADTLSRSLAKIRTGQASERVLDDVRVDYYGTSVPLSGLATISVPEPGLVVADPWDKSNVEAVAKAIPAAGLGLTPEVSEGVVRIPFPPSCIWRSSRDRSPCPSC
ncbi:ribosome-recycling factor [Streptomyces sp. NPDC090994]|uniref:ribosome-recycling factor n=1 Tax=Streptomyces sp. NPDC090994 TaxID=3365969 RepID=UPI0037F65376